MGHLHTQQLLARKILAELDVMLIESRLLQIDADQAVLNYLTELSHRPPENLVETWFRVEEDRSPLRVAS